MTALATAPIPGLPPAPPAAPDLRVTLGSLPDAAPHGGERWFASPRETSAGEPILDIHRIAPDRFHLRYADGTEFVVDASSGEIWARWPDPLTVEDTATYLTGPVMGFLLRRRGTTCLHASSVEIAGRAVVVTGPMGAGKSTTAAAFAASGRRVLSDDVTPLLPRGGGAFHVQPSYPQLRLWPDAAHALFGHEDALPRLTPGWDKRFLDLSADEKFSDEPLPLGAVYVLADRAEGVETARFDLVRGAAAVMALVPNVYMGYLPGPEARAADLERLGAVAASVPVVRVTPSDDPSRLPALVEAIAADFAARIA